MILITGCGRSGTKFISQVLSMCGLDIGHERLGKDGIASWLMASRSGTSIWGHPAPSSLIPLFNRRLHQVRHPLKVIASATTFIAQSWDYIGLHIDCTSSYPLLLKAAKYWLYWNELAEKLCEWTYRVEALYDQTTWQVFCAYTGVTCKLEVLWKVPNNVNTRYTAFTPISWNDIESLDRSLSYNIKEKAHLYGYIV